jgi:hypothetical protein
VPVVAGEEVGTVVATGAEGLDARVPAANEAGEAVAIDDPHPLITATATRATTGASKPRTIGSPSVSYPTNVRSRTPSLLP